MSESTTGHEVYEHPHVPYMKVFFALLIFTVIEVLYAGFMANHFPLLLTGLLAMAITKAVLVAMYFMHVKFEGKWVYMAIVPALVLAVILVTALTPDVTFHAEDADLIAPGGETTRLETAPSRIDTLLAFATRHDVAGSRASQ